jgi:hypothetical protein
VAFREVGVHEIKEVLRLWLRGEGIRSVARLAQVDRKKVRRYVEAARECGLDRAGGERQVGDALLSRVAELLRPHRSGGHGQSRAPRVGTCAGLCLEIARPVSPRRPNAGGHGCLARLTLSAIRCRRCRLPRWSIVPLPATVSRSPCGRRCGLGFAEPRHAVHSPGFGAYRGVRSRTVIFDPSRDRPACRHNVGMNIGLTTILPVASVLLGVLIANRASSQGDATALVWERRSDTYVGLFDWAANG